MRFKTLFIAGLLASVSPLASAQSYSNVISFGDSLSDNGNLYGLAGTPPAPYFNGRFSNGLVWSEILAATLHPQTGANGAMNNFGAVVPGANTNFAFGGARADNGTNLNNAAIPSVAQQIGAFQAYGGSFSSTSLVTLWAGANDIFQSVGSPATAVSVTTGSAATMGANLNMLGAMGARNIVVMNLPDLGQTPSYMAGGAPAIGLGSFATNTYNTALAAQISTAKAANPAINIIAINANAISSAILANPASFGFSNVTAQCIQTAACITGTAATQNQYFFWDGVHPTAAAHRIFASVVQQYVQYGTVATTTHSLNEVGFTNNQANLNRSLSRANGAMPSLKGEMTLEASTNSLKDNGGGNRTAYSGHVEGAHITFAKSASATLAWGVGANAQFGSVTQGLLKYSPTSFSLDGWMRWQSGNSFVNLAAGTSYNDYASYSRGSGIGGLSMTANPTGSSLGAALEIGQGFQTGGVTLTPSARLTAINSTVGAYKESGLIAPLAMSGRTLTGLLGSSQLRADMLIGGGLKGNATVGYQALLSSSGNSITAGLADNLVNPVTSNVSAMKSNGFYGGLGLAGKAGMVNLALDYNISMMNGTQHRLSGGVKLPF